MPALTPQFLFDFESNMQAITENEYARFAANMWWSKFMRTRPSGSRQEIIAWLLSTAKIENLEKMGGKVPFEDLVSTYTTFESQYAGAGLRLRRAQVEDLDGNGLELAGKWSGDIGAYMGYWPQKQLINLVKNGHLATSKSYDQVPFFSASHPVNPFNTAAGTYSNLFTGGTAAPIDSSVTLDVALDNVSKVIAAVRAIKMPNGEDPRFLRPTGLVVPPRLQQRAVQLTNAKFIAQAAASGGGSADVQALIASFGFVEPVVSDELAGFESDTTWFLACEEISSSQLGGFVYVDREPFRINYYTGAGGGTGVDAQLDRTDELEWHCKGRNVAGYGHPYAFFKVKAA
jgi:phage major head subunit gpT-like protein